MSYEFPMGIHVVRMERGSGWTMCSPLEAGLYFGKVSLCKYHHLHCRVLSTSSSECNCFILCNITYRYHSTPYTLHHDKCLDFFFFFVFNSTMELYSLSILG